MACPRGQVVHVRLEVLDYAVLVRGREERAGMRKLHRAHRRVVRLQNCLEVEGQAIPQREFATR